MMTTSSVSTWPQMNVGFDKCVCQQGRHEVFNMVDMFSVCSKLRTGFSLNCFLIHEWSGMDLRRTRFLSIGDFCWPPFEPDTVRVLVRSLSEHSRSRRRERTRWRGFKPTVDWLCWGRWGWGLLKRMNVGHKHVENWHETLKCASPELKLLSFLFRSPVLGTRLWAAHCYSFVCGLYKHADVQVPTQRMLLTYLSVLPFTFSKNTTRTFVFVSRWCCTTAPRHFVLWVRGSEKGPKRIRKQPEKHRSERLWNCDGETIIRAFEKLNAERHSQEVNVLQRSDWSKHTKRQ